MDKQRHLLGQLKPKRKGSRGQRCRHCCEICHRPCSRVVQLDQRERIICQTCDGARRRRQRGKSARQRWQRIFYVAAGEPKAWRCPHGSAHFVVAAAGDVDVLIVCAFGYRHEVISGFFFEDELDRYE